MKISNKKYAQALLEATEGKSEKEAKQIITRLLKLMIADNGLKNTYSLIENFVELWNKKNNLAKVDITTAVDMTPASQKMITKYISKILGAEHIEINKRIDKSILGGVIVREGDRILDGSLRGRLYDLKKEIAK